jgi:hypothetical protein
MQLIVWLLPLALASSDGVLWSVQPSSPFAGQFNLAASLHLPHLEFSFVPLLRPDASSKIRRALFLLLLLLPKPI